MNVYEKLRPQIIRNLTEIDDVLDYLHSGEHITKSNYGSIRSEKNDSDKIREMLNILIKRSCPPQTFMKILSETGNEFLEKQFRKYLNMEIEVAEEKPMPQARDKRRVFILEGMEQDEILRKCFSRKNPDWEVSNHLGSINKLKEVIGSVPENKFSYFDIIVLCDEEGKHITNESLKTILPCIEKELLPEFPPSIITLLIIVNDEETESKPVQESPSVNMDDLQNSRPVQEPQSENMNDLQESQTVTGVLKADSCEIFFNAFTESKEMFNVFIRKADTRKQLGLQVY
ncbi:XP_036369559.1uncharacterized protein LOC118768008 isoform X2 [Octopus vulgaris]|uniref:XP_036369559.1uncharacterized protein LOC118768008 isoform X2 n=1 Tax=Octopus vulgaris TaxID=6645 RepID=A0AA36BWS6_OCTVU|nr:XP_036369559.1uncharacterized protein LOC118768008 isoform X2 [Octopus vulgaris]